MSFLNTINIAYFEIDFKKYHITFFKKTNLYIFWHWTYALQCTHLYSSIGYFDEVSFTRELFRLLLLLEATDPIHIDSLKCPIPELRSYWDKYFNRIKELASLIANTNSFKSMYNNLSRQIQASVNNLDIEANDPKATISSINKVPEFMSLLASHCEVNAELDIDVFMDFIHKQLSALINLPNRESNSAYYRILSFISYYNLKSIYEKFDGEHRLLRRNYMSGLPIEHFLANDHSYYIDPFGGFFINNIDERSLNMSTNNKMLFLIWHIGVILKKKSFKKP